MVLTVSYFKPLPAQAPVAASASVSAPAAAPPHHDAPNGIALFFSWLLGIARRVCADHVRMLTRRRRLDALLSQLPVPRLTPDPVSGVAARDLLDRLSEERRSAFVLTQYLGLSYAEAAAVEGVPVGTIRSRVARARDDLIAALAESQAS